MSVNIKDSDSDIVKWLKLDASFSSVAETFIKSKTNKTKTWSYLQNHCLAETTLNVITLLLITYETNKHFGFSAVLDGSESSYL
jgi:hypothetical protein